MANALAVPVIDLDYRRGDSRPIIFVLTNTADGLPLDLTGYTAPVLAVNSLQEPPDNTTELFKVTGVIDGDVTTGRISFTPTITNTDQTPDLYYYDAQVLDASAGVLTFVQGKFNITQDIAKD